jgi:cobalt-precorrin 5A hydrolase
MGGDKVMSRPISIGIGCRSGCAGPAIESAVRLALSRVPDGVPLGLFTIADKCEEAGLTAAAASLGFPLFMLPRTVLRDQAASVETVSRASHHRFGVPSVSEAAALAGAGPGAILLVPRIVRDGVTCAIAEPGVAGPGGAETGVAGMGVAGPGGAGLSVAGVRVGRA